MGSTSLGQDKKGKGWTFFEGHAIFHLHWDQQNGKRRKRIFGAGDRVLVRKTQRLPWRERPKQAQPLLPHSSLALFRHRCGIMKWNLLLGIAYPNSHDAFLFRWLQENSHRNHMHRGSWRQWLLSNHLFWAKKCLCRCFVCQDLCQWSLFRVSLHLLCSWRVLGHG